MIDTDGHDAGTYRRLHRSPDDAGLISTGDSIVAVQTSRVKLGVLIGADVEFPEQGVALALERARLLAVCAAWTLDESEAARALLTARAIESQSFVVAASGGTERPGSHPRGGSVVIGPGGALLARGGADDEIVLATVDVDDQRAELAHRDEHRGVIQRAAVLLPGRAGDDVDGAPPGRSRGGVYRRRTPRRSRPRRSVTRPRRSPRCRRWDGS